LLKYHVWKQHSRFCYAKDIFIANAERLVFTSVPEAVAFIEEHIQREPDVYDMLPRTMRQAARFPYIHTLLAELGNPHEGLRIAHVAGTSGKGSTATLISTIVQANGCYTGLYTNPYITQPQERIQIGGQYIDNNLFIECTSDVAEAVKRVTARNSIIGPNIKALWVAIMLLAFKRANVELAVVETGMGGRYDETNVVMPSTATITTIGFDHMDFLGDTLPAIAYHKAGIIKPGIQAITGLIDPASHAIIAAESVIAGASLSTLSKDFSFGNIRQRIDGTTFDYIDEMGISRTYHIPLIGTHQAYNAALAIHTSRRLFPSIQPATIQEGLNNAWLPGRFEVINRHPIIVLDVAHNPDKMRSLIQTTRAIFSEMPVWIVFGVLSAKDSEHMIATWRDLPLKEAICTKITILGKQVADPTKLAAAIQAQGMVAHAQVDPFLAIEEACKAAGSQGIVLVTGSIYLISQVRDFLISR
jgi:dihydrofolate synthase / folylpolyglutamate synthase